METATTRKCPYCAEDIRLEAIKCKWCGSMLDGSPPTSSQISVEVCPHCGEGQLIHYIANDANTIVVALGTVITAISAFVLFFGIKHSHLMEGHHWIITMAFLAGGMYMVLKRDKTECKKCPECKNLFK